MGVKVCQVRSKFKWRIESERITEKNESIISQIVQALVGYKILSFTVEDSMIKYIRKCCRLYSQCM